MPKKKYIVDLSEEERSELKQLLKKGKLGVRKVKRAQTLLLADQGQSDSEIATALQLGQATVQRVRQRFVAGNLAGALNEKPRLGANRKRNEKGEAILEHLARSQPPTGRKRWTLALLSDRLVALQVIDDISRETVRQVLKKKDVR